MPSSPFQRVKTQNSTHGHIHPFVLKIQLRKALGKDLNHVKFVALCRRLSSAKIPLGFNFYCHKALAVLPDERADSMTDIHVFLVNYKPLNIVLKGV